MEDIPDELSETDYEPQEIETNNYGDINKLGQIDYQEMYIDHKRGICVNHHDIPKPHHISDIIVVNSYTQYSPGSPLPGDSIPLDYDALRLCMKKINYRFKGKHIGLPKIGAGLAGGSWSIIKKIIQSELWECDVTIVEFNK